MHKTRFDSREKLWSGKPLPTIYNLNQSVGKVLLQKMKNHPSRIALINADADTRLTYEEVYMRSIRLAQNIQKWNYEKGDVFAIVSKNNSHLMSLYVALLCLDGPINPIIPDFGEHETMHMLKITKPKVVFTDMDAYVMVKRCVSALKWDVKLCTIGGRVDDSTVLSIEDLYIATECGNEFEPIAVDGENDVAIIMCSSGTTGIPKGISFTHAGLLAIFPQYETDTTMKHIPFTFTSSAWLGGLLSLLCSVIHSSTLVTTSKPFAPQLFLKIIEKYKVTNMSTVPHQWILTLKCDEFRNANLSTIKQCDFGGGKLPLEMIRTIRASLVNGHLVQRYGMTEGGIIASNFPILDTETVGQLVSGIVMKIVDANGKRLGVGEDGEICFRRAIRFAGYYGDQEATQALIDAEEFIRTGDIGHFDEHGFLYLVGRKKDFIMIGIHKVAPTTIEDILLKDKRIKCVCVVGVPDAVYGELVAATVIRSDAAEINEQEVYDIIAAKCCENSHLRGGVYFVDSLPLTASGKFIRTEVRQIVVELAKRRKESM